MIASSPSQWHALAHAVAGGRHVRSGRPGQDAAVAFTTPRPGLLACDGRGSSARSELGSAAAVAALPHLLYQLDGPLTAVLDGGLADPAAAELAWRRCATLLLRGLASELARLTALHGGTAREYEFTAALALVGTHHVGCLSLGDCSLVLSHAGHCTAVLAPLPVEFASDTRFVAYEPAPELHLRTCLVPAADLDGLAAFSDGTAAKLIHARTGDPIAGFTKLLDYASNPDGALQLAGFLTAPFWQTTVDDDRCLALLRRAAPASEPAFVSAPAVPAPVIVSAPQTHPSIASAPPTTSAETPLLTPAPSPRAHPQRRRLLLLLALVATATALVLLRPSSPPPVAPAPAYPPADSAPTDAPPSTPAPLATALPSSIEPEAAPTSPQN